MSEPYAGFYADAVAHPTGHLLVACPPVDPSPGQVRIVERAIAQARAAGLNVPASSATPQWRDRPRDRDRRPGDPLITDGCVRTLEDGRIAMYLDANLWPDELERVALHEIQHIHDTASGLWRNLSREEMEERADTFAASMMGRR